MCKLFFLHSSCIPGYANYYTTDVLYKQMTYSAGPYWILEDFWQEDKNTLRYNVKLDSNPNEWINDIFSKITQAEIKDYKGVEQIDYLIEAYQKCCKLINAYDTILKNIHEPTIKEQVIETVTLLKKLTETHQDSIAEEIYALAQLAREHFPKQIYGVYWDFYNPYIDTLFCFIKKENAQQFIQSHSQSGVGVIKLIDLTTVNNLKKWR